MNTTLRNWNPRIEKSHVPSVRGIGRVLGHLHPTLAYMEIPMMEGRRFGSITPAGPIGVVHIHKTILKMEFLKKGLLDSRGGVGN